MVKSIRVWKVAFLAAAVAAYPAEAQDCLFADTGSVPPSQCRDDVYNVSTEPSVVRAVARLGFQPSEVRFQACAVGRFATGFRNDTGIFTISYPLTADYDFGSYVGPLAHELGHATQIREAGSMQALFRSMSDSARRELGADFLAGFIFRRFMENLDQQGFEESLDLLGNYDLRPQATHSQPEARSSAFRMGFFFQNAAATALSAHREFQRNRFGTIMNALLR